MAKGTKDRIPAVVYASNSPSGFGVIRSLHACGIPVIGLDSHRGFAGLSNKFKAELCPDPLKDHDRFIEHVRDLGKRLGKAALFASGDLSLYLFSIHRDILEPHFHFPYLDKASLEAGLDKWRMYEIARQSNIPVPFTLLPKSEDDLREEALRFPVVLKPVTCQFVMGESGPRRINDFLKAYSYRKVLRAVNREELLTASKELFGSGFSFLVQEEIPGPANQFYDIKFYIGKNGDSDEWYVGKKVRQMPADFGICSLGEGARSEKVLEYSKSFVRAAGFRGLGDIEYKYDSRDGAYKFIEMNPRATQQIFQATFAGLNLPARQYEDLTGTHVQKAASTLRDINWIMLESELSYFAKYWLDKKSSHRISVRRWIGSIFSKPVTEAYLAWDDLLLSLAYLARCASLFVMKLAKNILLALTGINVTKR